MVKVHEILEQYMENFLSSKQRPGIPGGQNPHMSKFQQMVTPNNKINEFEIDDNGGFGNLVPISINLEIEGKRIKE